MRDMDQIDSVFRLLDRQVWIVTSAAGSRRGGLVATWISQTSIDPEAPGVLAGIAPNHFTAELIDASGSFALHLITADQLDHAWNFALGSGRTRDKLSGLRTTTAQTGSPLLHDCLAWLDCRVFARLPCGDRTYYWADVVAGAKRGEGVPLTEQQLLAAADPHQRQQLLADRQQDVLLQRPLRAHWRADLPALLNPAEGAAE